jgi:hypothetical protein
MKIKRITDPYTPYICPIAQKPDRIVTKALMRNPTLFLANLFKPGWASGVTMRGGASILRSVVEERRNEDATSCRNSFKSVAEPWSTSSDN